MAHERIPARYPKRPRFWAYRFCRVVAKACAANDIGHGACWLLSVIAHTEDAKGYRDAVTFFNDQLAPIVGAKNVKALARMRKKAVDSGWLVYLPGAKSTPGRYWTQIPAAHQDWDDEPTDEPGRSDGVEGVDYSGSKSTQETGAKRADPGVEPVPTAPAPDPEPEAPQTIGPTPAAVVAHWNAHPGLTPAVATEPHRDRVIRQWAMGNPLWAMHWRSVIAFMGRTPWCCGGGERNWRATIKWLLEKSNFSDLVEKMLAASGPPPRAAASEFRPVSRALFESHPPRNERNES